MAINICIGRCAITYIKLILVILLEKGRVFFYTWVHATAHRSHVYTLHLLMVLLEGQEIGAALRCSLISLFLLAAVLTSTIYVTHLTSFLTTLLHRGNDI